MFRNHTNEAAVGVGGRASARRLLVAIALALTAATAVSAAASQDEPNITVREERGVYTVAATFTVPQAGSFVVAVLTDYAQIPRFMPEVHTSTILERSEHGAVVEQGASARFMMFSKRIHLVLEIEEHAGVLRFHDRCGQSFARYDGGWIVTSNADGALVTYELTAKPSFQVPEFLLKRLLKRDALQMIERLRVEIGARAKV